MFSGWIIAKSREAINTLAERVHNKLQKGAGYKRKRSKSKKSPLINRKHLQNVKKLQRRKSIKIQEPN